MCGYDRFKKYFYCQKNKINHLSSAAAQLNKAVFKPKFKPSFSNHRHNNVVRSLFSHVFALAQGFDSWEEAQAANLKHLECKPSLPLFELHNSSNKTQNENKNAGWLGNWNAEPCVNLNNADLYDPNLVVDSNGMTWSGYEVFRDAWCPAVR